MSDISVFERLCNNLNQHEALHIPSPPTQKRRAAVAAILRWRRQRTDIAINNLAPPKTIQEFFEQPWVKQDTQGTAEILFMQRATRAGDRWSGHVSFVGGKNETGETDQDTVKREVMEEVGLNLGDSNSYIQVGKLNEREITSVKDNTLLMILIPFVYLQVVPDSPPFKLQESEVAAVQWVPISFFLSTEVYPSARTIKEPLSIVRLNKHQWLIKPLIRFMMGSILFPAIDLPTTSSNTKRLFSLWGLTMGMTRDIIELTTDTSAEQKRKLAFLELSSIKPIYTRPDIGWLTILITRLTLLSRTNMEWDKVYFASIKRAVMVAILLRLGITSLIVTLIIKKILSK